MYIKIANISNSVFCLFKDVRVYVRNVVKVDKKDDGS